MTTTHQRPDEDGSAELEAAQMGIWTGLSGLDYQHRYVDAGGIRTRAVQTGPEDAEHIVFLHGTSGHLEAFVRNLPAHARRYRCHAIDMLGLDLDRT